MDRDTKAYKLRTEGINGLKIISRDLIPYEQRRKIEEEPIDAQGDMRYSYKDGVYVPREDYMISGEGRPPLVVREVKSKVQGMKKYALLDMRDAFDTTVHRRGIFGKKNRNSFIDVNYVYSEGVDFEKMIDDPKYASAVISLFQENRLAERRDISKGNNSDIVYIGTIAEKDGEYVKMARPEYKTVIETIGTEIEKKEQEYREAERASSAARVEKAQKTAKQEEAKRFASTADRDQAKETLKVYLERFGVEGLKAIITELAEERENAQSVPTNEDEYGYNDDDDEQPLW